MLKILPSRYRYPLFFLGIFIIEIAGVLFKVTDITKTGIVGMVAAGFVIFAFSILAT
ncbi:MAG: hypothetical protein LVQ63_06030 [Thermoplasmatales archaeon]|nr:hypothetical protein [Thermoplasmatales archaeon]